MPVQTEEEFYNSITPKQWKSILDTWNFQNEAGKDPERGDVYEGYRICIMGVWNYSKKDYGDNYKQFISDTIYERGVTAAQFIEASEPKYGKNFK